MPGQSSIPLFRNKGTFKVVFNNTEAQEIIQVAESHIQRYSVNLDIGSRLTGKSKLCKHCKLTS